MQFIKARDSQRGNFFLFKPEYIDNSKKNCYYKYTSWSGLSFTKFSFNQIEYPKEYYLDSFLKLKKKIELTIIVTKGDIKFFNSIKLKTFDCLNFFSENLSVKFKINKKVEFFIIYCTNRKPARNQFIKFNFLKEIKPVDLWGGKCKSRVFNTNNTTIVLFHLKERFAFHDKGHRNSQITWLIDGSIEFYNNNKKKKMTPSIGIDVGKNTPHGGFSLGAVGFDAFYPKRREKKYRKGD